MAPSAVDIDVPNGKHSYRSGRTSTNPLRKTGALDTAHAFEEVTPVIGREYPKTNIVDDLLQSDELLRDLAITSMPPHLVCPC